MAQSHHSHPHAAVPASGAAGRVAAGHDHTGQHGHTHGPGAADPSLYEWKVHHPFDDVAGRAAIEVSPRRGLLPRWRFVVPHDFTAVVRWGVGLPGGREITTDVKRPVQSGPTQLVKGPTVIWFGGHEALSSRLSAYLVFEGHPPHYVAFGQADEPGGPPLRLEGISFADHHRSHA